MLFRLFVFLNSDIVEILRTQLGNSKVLIGDALLSRYHHIWKMDIPLEVKAVVLPESTKDVSVVLKACNQLKQNVVVHGGLTNLVGSTEVEKEDLVISMEKMNVIEEVDDQSRTISVQAGVIVQKIQNAAKEKGLLFPLNFGAAGTAQIGGAISTNAGGLQVLRFGMTRKLVLGLEVVLADGTIISSMKKIIKDNSGYDIKQLFIGSEGTLGVVTKAVLKLVEEPKSRNSAFVAFNNYKKVVEFLKYLDSNLAGTLSSFELLWNLSYKTLTGSNASVKPPLSYDYKYYVLFESLGADQEKDRAVMESLLQNALENEMILDAIPANTSADLDWFWTIREDVRVLAIYSSFDQHFDVSLPIPFIGNYTDMVIEKVIKLEGVEVCFTYGHVADGNIHFVVGKTNDKPQLTNRINDLIYGPLQDMGGSVSAEHGIGVHKKKYLSLSRSEDEIALFKTLKKTLDPNSILNRGKVIDVEE